MCKYIFKESVEPMISLVFFTGVIMVSTYFIGHTNNAKLIAGVGMGNMLMNVLAFSEIQGMNMAVQTLVSKAYGASKDEDCTPEVRAKMRRECGIIFNKGRLSSTFLLIPIALVFTFSEQLLKGLGQNHAVSEITGKFLIMMIPGIWAQGQFDASRRFLSSMMLNSFHVRV